MTTVTPPRIRPGGPRDVGRVTWALLWVGTRRRGGSIPNVFRILGLHRSAFKPWLLYASRLMPNGLLTRAESELVILRVAARTGSAYERFHHESIGRQAGLSDALISWSESEPGDLVPAPDDGGLEPAHAALLCRATDELLDTHDLSDATWGELAERYDERRLLELCLLVGQYAGLAATLNAARVQLEPGASQHRLR